MDGVEARLRRLYHLNQNNMAYYNGPRRKKKVDPSLVRRKGTAEEFENSLNRVKDRVRPVAASDIKMIGGVPHKYKDGKWVPLTKI